MAFHLTSRPAALARLAAIAALCAALSACVTAPKNPLSTQQAQSLAIEEIAVVTTPETSIWWGDAEREFAASKGCEQQVYEPQNDDLRIEQPKSDCDYDALIESPEAQAYLVKQTVDGLQGSLDGIVKPRFSGTDPVKLQVTVDQVTIVSAGQSMLVGGAHVLMADFEIVDIETGQPLARYEDMFVQAGYGAGGIIAIIAEASADQPPYQRLTSAYANSVNDWLLDGPR